MSFPNISKFMGVSPLMYDSNSVSLIFIFDAIFIEHRLFLSNASKTIADISTLPQFSKGKFTLQSTLMSNKLPSFSKFTLDNLALYV